MATNSTSLWICNGIAFALFIAKLALRKIKGQRFNAGDYWTMSASAFLIARVVVSHYILLHGTTTVLSDKERADLPSLGTEKTNWLELNSKLNLVSRAVLNSTLWSLKMVVLDLCRRMIHKIPREFTILYTFWVVLACTYVAATIAIFVECRPFNRYWQLSPNPGECVKGNVWLLTYEIGNITTDSMLLALPFPLLFHAKTTLSKRLRLLSLFSLGFFLIAVSIVRMIQGNKNARIQLSRTMWASIETLFASMVAMVPALYILLRPKMHDTSYSLSSDGRTHPSQSQGVTFTRSKVRPSKSWRQSPSHHSHGLSSGTMESRAWTELRSVERQDAEDASTKGILAVTTVTHMQESESGSGKD
ncbi:Nn.00g070600.m01.CDS01 [Neocucurbitaria sp. VM-36]